MKFALIDAEKATFPIGFMCMQLGVSRSGYYAWKDREPSARAVEDDALAAEIKALHAESRRTYGSPRIYAKLKTNGRRTSRKRIAKLMRREGLAARKKRRFRRTTDSNHSFPIAPNLLDRNFTVDAPNKAWVTDITYVWTSEGWLYLAAIVDLYSRMIVGWAVSTTIDRKLCLDALTMAILRRRPPAGLIHHSDRGSQYASGDYRKALASREILCSMSRKGDCWDNAVAESLWSTIKAEAVPPQGFPSRAEGLRVLFEYMEVFYNRKRIHSHLGYVTPAQFEALALPITKAA